MCIESIPAWAFWTLFVMVVLLVLSIRRELDLSPLKYKIEQMEEALNLLTDNIKELEGKIDDYPNELDDNNDYP